MHSNLTTILQTTGVYVDFNTITQAAEVLGAILAIGGAVFAIFKWFQKQKQQDIDIKELKKETCLLTYGVLACLKGLSEQGCNGPVTEAINKIEKHINEKAHDQI